jgi:DinB family
MLHHLWVSEEGTRRVALENNFSYYETRIPKGLRATLGPAATLEETLASLQRVHDETLAAVGACPASVFEEERVRPEFGFRRKVWVILLGINEHEVHHRAQLSTYLRLLGKPLEDVAKSYRPAVVP